MNLRAISNQIACKGILALVAVPLLVSGAGAVPIRPPNALLATINPTPYDANFSIDGSTVSIDPGVLSSRGDGDTPLFWHLTPGHWHTLSVVTTAGYSRGNPNNIRTYDRTIVARCSVRIQPKVNDDFIVLPSTPGATGPCRLYKFDHTFPYDLND